jgi:YbbR domain-containing protein
VVGQITAEPATVEIEGPESHIKKLASAITEPISVTGARANVRDVVAVGLVDSTCRLVRPQNVTVIVEVLPAPIERELSEVLVRARNLGSGIAAPRISPRTVTLSVRGHREALAGVDPETVEAFVDLTGLGPGQYSLRVQVDPSEHFGVADISPTVVDVTIRAIK